ncbi:uncharacterized protein LOC115759356 [Drosophila novamexicana]|uniref:uncharacterized protein LOC115759356 n=1 Tax=Drosophila novamexicana TaxID=47314 RepID=UPI0011E5B271|nr:uncharacterized protein LOC115759356 [Drosophila novamexicana]
MDKMELLRIWCCLVIIFLLSSALAEYLVRVDQFNFEVGDRELIVSQSASIEQDGNRSYLSGHLIVAKPINEISMLASMDISRPSLPRVRLFATKMDLCSFFNNDYKSKFVQQFYNRYVNFINVRPRCPLQANVNYSLQRSYIDERILPELLPECSYFLKLEFRNKTKHLAQVLISGHITPVANKVPTPKFRVKF